jgi:hypothetical protein
MTRISSGCVLTKVNQLFTCEKNCNSVEARKALLKDFTSKVYNAEAGYIDSDGNIASEEQYNIVFILSGNQKDRNLNIIHGNALLQKDEDEDTPKNLVWRGNYLAKKGYKIRVSGDNFEKDFYIYCGGNDKINFLFKKTDSETSETVRQVGSGNKRSGVGSMQSSSSTSLEQQLKNLNNKLADLIEKEKNATNPLDKVYIGDQIDATQLNILIVQYRYNKTIPDDLKPGAEKNCITNCDGYNFCQDSEVKTFLKENNFCQ